MWFCYTQIYFIYIFYCWSSNLSPPFLLPVSSIPPTCLLHSSWLSPPFFLSVSSIPPACLLHSSCLSPPFLLPISSIPPTCLLHSSYLSPPFLLPVSSILPVSTGRVQLVSPARSFTYTLVKNLTRPFPGVAIKQWVWSARLGFSRSSMQKDLSMPQCIPLTLLERGDFGSLQGWADHEKLERWDLIEAKANILN